MRPDGGTDDLIALVRSSQSRLEALESKIEDLEFKARVPVPWTSVSHQLGDISYGPEGASVNYTLPEFIPINVTNVLFHWSLMQGPTGDAGWYPSAWKITSVVNGVEFARYVLNGGIWASDMIRGNTDAFWLPVDPVTRQVEMRTTSWDGSRTFIHLYGGFSIIGYQ